MNTLIYLVNIIICTYMILFIWYMNRIGRINNSIIIIAIGRIPCIQMRGNATI